MRKIAAFVVAFALAACMTGVVRAAESFTSYGVNFVAFPIGVRNVGMGGVGTADASNVSTGYFNPAGLAFVDATTLSGSHEDLITDFNLSGFALSTPVPLRADSSGSWNFTGGLSYTKLSVEMIERTIFFPEGTGNTIELTDWLLGGTAAASWTHGVVSLAAGTTAKYIDVGSASLWSFDVGALAAFPFEADGARVRPRLGYSALNLDTGYTSGNAQYVTTEQRAGVGFDLEAPDVAVWGRAVPSVDFSFDYDRIDRENAPDERYAAGFEISVLDLMHFRYGTSDNDFTAYGMGLGWDYGSVLFRVDYAHTKPRDEDAWEFTPGLDPERDAFGALVGVRW